MAYKVPPLRFTYDALEPYIDAETMELHHDFGPKAANSPKSAIADAITKDFGSFERFQSLFTDVAAKRVGAAPQLHA